VSGIPIDTLTVESLVEAAKGWTLARFASAEGSEFVLPPHRFELRDAGVRRFALAPRSPEAASPLDAVARVSVPTAWSHSTLVTLLADSETGTFEFEQEMVEILVMDGEAVLVEAAPVIRIPGFAPFLGPFHGF
jgi:predicted NAD-dependent protein-ADP-ribosyltransferase YbiA (DUF1768 family)